MDKKPNRFCIRAIPNPALLQAVMRTKHLMNPQVLAMARQLVAKVFAELIEKFAKEVQRTFNGTRKRLLIEKPLFM